MTQQTTGAVSDGSEHSDGSGGVIDGGEAKATLGLDDDDSTEGRVSYKTYQRAVDQAKAAKRQAREALEQVERMKSERESGSRKELEGQGDYKRLLEAERARAAELERSLQDTAKQLTDYSQRDQDRRRLAALHDQLGGGNPKALFRLADLDQIVIDPDSGEIDKVSLTRYAEKFKKEWPDYLPRSAANMPTTKPGAGKGPAERITGSQYASLATSKEMNEWLKRDKEFPGSIIWDK